MITVTPVNGAFRVTFPYDASLVESIKALPQRKWDKDTKGWIVSGATDLVAWLQKHGEVIPQCLSEALKLAQANLKASHETTSTAVLPCPAGLAYLPYQQAGIAYAMARPSSLIADEMGLGKTIQAIGISNTDPGVRNILIICPASLKLNWEREWIKWDVKGLSVGIASSTNFPDTQVVIINYDIVRRNHLALRDRRWDLLIVDEAHALKNPKAQRTVAVFGKREKVGEEWVWTTTPLEATRKVFLTGTPILNRPAEAWTLVHALAPSVFSSWKAFMVRYAAGSNATGVWDISGASNLDELQRRLRECIMVRRLKSEVLTELPPKRRQLLVIPAEGEAIKAIKHEQDAYAARDANLATLRANAEALQHGNEEAYKEATRALQEGTLAAFAEISKERHEVALSKLPQVIEHLQDMVNEQGVKVVCFGHHKDVIAGIAQAFGHAAVVITGETPMQTRQDNVDRFQTDETCRIFVGNIIAAGVGLTLTASSHVVFAELDWRPGMVSQAEDRCHRIGQRDSVTVQHIVLDGSLDAHMAQTILEKQRVIDAALDDEIKPVVKENYVATPKAEAPKQIKILTPQQQAIATVAEGLSPEVVGNIHRALQTLAGVCNYAQSWDGQGFNKMDAGLGHSLAERPSLTPKQAALGQRLVRRYYKTQLAGYFTEDELGFSAKAA